MTDPDRVFVDTNELFPFSIMDLILALAEDLLIDFVWSDELLEEWERVIVRDGGRSTEAAQAVAEAVRRFFDSSRIDPTSYRSRVESVPGRDPDDRVHTAACAYGGATVLLTKNQRDFPTEFLSRHGVMVASADQYLTALLRRRPTAFVETVQRLADQKRYPTRTACDLADGLRVGGATRLASALSRRLDCP